MRFPIEPLLAALIAKCIRQHSLRDSLGHKRFYKRCSSDFATLRLMKGQVPSSQQVIETLTGTLVPLDVAKKVDGLPAAGGLYAWWARNNSIPQVPACPHPSEPFDLFYLGIAPKDENSSATIRSRVISNHINGNTGSSTFRKTLAALLFQTKGWQPRMTDRPLLTSEDNKALKVWQHRNLRLTWVKHPRPWEIERELIAQLRPPLNLAGNTSHPFSQTLTKARKDFRAAAKSDSSDSRFETSQTARIRRPVPESRKSSTVPVDRVKLHDEIAATLRENDNRWMSTEEIASEIVYRKQYVKKDGTSDVTAFQIHGRTKQDGGYSHLFERKGAKVRLKAP